MVAIQPTKLKEYGPKLWLVFWIQLCKDCWPLGGPISERKYVKD